LKTFSAGHGTPTTARRGRDVAGSCTFDVLSITAAECTEDRLFEIESALKAAFQNADFTEPFGPESPWTHTHEGLTGSNSGRYRHVIAQHDRHILGAVFCVPVERRDGEDADPGWFFVDPELHLRMRAEVVREVLQEAHRLMRDAGFPRVVTKMGTHTGARLLSRHFGYVQAPVEGQENRWTREL
jgi:hypothetical protein